jgi:hypothetical protein
VSATDLVGSKKDTITSTRPIVANAAVMRAKARKVEAEIQCYEVPTNREGVLKALNQFGHHPNKE